jgi:predicted DNA binding protein
MTVLEGGSDQGEEILFNARCYWSGQVAARRSKAGTTKGERSDGDKGVPRKLEPILSCRVRVSLPDELWFTEFTRSNPDVRLDILDRLELGNGLTMLEVRVVSSAEGHWTDEIRSLKGVREVELIDAAGGSETCRVIFRGKTFIPLIKQLKLLRHFPFPIQDGVATWTVVGPDRKVKEMIRVLETTTEGTQVIAIRHGPLPGGLALLTPRQQEILRIAMAEGYFDVPRRISLTQLAGKLGVALSTLSVTLAVIEKKILEPHT